MNRNDKRASGDEFDELHKLLADTLREQLQAWRDKKLVDMEGEYVVQIPPAFLAQIIKFLKDNGIDSPGKLNRAASELAASLPEFSEDEALESMAH